MPTELTAAEVEHRIQTTRRMTPAQAQYVTDLVNARFAPDDEQSREYWRGRWYLVTSHRHVSALIEDLKEFPTLVQREREAADAARRAEEQRAKDVKPTEDGFYRNPETEELFRLRYDAKSFGFIISKYTQTGGPRRLVRDTGEIVKGKFERWTAFNSRVALSQGKIDKAWKIDAETLAREYAYNFCPLHGGPLTDAVSVVLGYGPDCAKKFGLPWGEDEMNRVLAERAATKEN